MSDRIKLGSLWKKTSQKGTTFLSGEISRDADLTGIGPGWRLTVFTNGYKETERHPDYIVYAEPPQEKTAPKNAPKPPVKTAKATANLPLDGDDIPF